MIKAVFFDLDGVITKEGSLIKNKIHPAIKDEISYEELHDRYQKAKVAKISFDDFCMDLNKEKVLSFMNTDLERKDITKILIDLSKKYPLYLASNHIQPMGGYEIDKIGIRKYFTKLYFSSDLKLAKPDVRYFKEILNDLKIEGKNVLYIDDAKLNLRSAKELGIITVWMNNNDNNIRNQIDFKPDYSIENIKDLVNISKRLDK